MAVTVGTCTTVSANQNGKLKETVATMAISSTYATGGFVLTAAQAQAVGVDGKVMWMENDPATPWLAKWNSSTAKMQLFAPNGAAAAGAEVTNATPVTSTLIFRVLSIGSAAAAPFSV